MKRFGLLVLLLSTLAAAGVPGLKTVNAGREGQPLAVSDHVARGRVTVVEFSSRSCPKCLALEPKLDSLAAKAPQVAVCRVEIDRPGSVGIDWQSPLARQYNLSSVPYFQVYQPDGKILAEGEAARRIVVKLLRDSDIL